MRSRGRARGPGGRRAGQPPRLGDAAAAAARRAARGRPRARRPPGAAGHRRRPLGTRPGRRPARLPRAAPGPLYPSRGTGYASHVTPPPHLVGLRIDALDALRGPRSDACVVASATALAEAVPDASAAPGGLRALASARRSTSTPSPRDLARPATSASTRSRSAASSPARRHPRRLPGHRGARGPDRALRRRDRVDALVLDLHAALARRRRAGRAGPGRRARRRAPRARRAGGDGGRPRRGGRPRAWPRCCRSTASARRSTWSPRRRRWCSSPPEEIEPALRDHWEDATTAMHADDAAASTSMSPSRWPSARRSRSPPPARTTRTPSAPRAPSRRREASKRPRGAGEAGPLRLPHGRRLRQPGEAERARYGLDRLDATLLDGDASRPSPGSLRRGAPARGLRQPRAEAGRLSLPPPRPPPPPADERGPARQWPPRLQRPAGRRPRRPRGPRRRPLRGFETREVGGVTRDYLYLEYKGEDRVYVPTDQLAKLSRYVGAGGEPGALRARRQTLAEHEGARPPAAGRPGRRAAQPLRRAPHPQGPRLPARRRVADGDGGRLPLPRDRRPDGSDRGGQGRHGGRAADGPAGLRRRRLRQDRGGAAGRRQGGRRRQAGDDAGADDDPRPAASSAPSASASPTCPSCSTGSHACASRPR